MMVPNEIDARLEAKERVRELVANEPELASETQVGTLVARHRHAVGNGESLRMETDWETVLALLQKRLAKP